MGKDEDNENFFTESFQFYYAPKKEISVDKGLIGFESWAQLLNIYQINIITVSGSCDFVYARVTLTEQ